MSNVINSVVDYTCSFFVSGEEVDDCSICWSPLKKSLFFNNLIETKCHHIFHKSCLTPWLESKLEKSCPNCRTAHCLTKAQTSTPPTIPLNHGRVEYNGDSIVSGSPGWCLANGYEEVVGGYWSGDKQCHLSAVFAKRYQKASDAGLRKIAEYVPFSGMYKYQAFPRFEYLQDKLGGINDRTKNDILKDLKKWLRTGVNAEISINNDLSTNQAIAYSRATAIMDSHNLRTDDYLRDPIYQFINEYLKEIEYKTSDTMVCQIAIEKRLSSIATVVRSILGFRDA